MRNIFTKPLLLISLCMSYWSVIGQPAGDTADPSSILAEIAREYASYQPVDYGKYPLGVHTDSAYRAQSDYKKALLDRLRKLESSELADTERITWELLEYQLQEGVDSYAWGLHLNPPLADHGFHLDLNYRIRPLRSLNSAERYIRMLHAIPDFTEQYLVLLRQGLQSGNSQPRAIFEGFEQTYNSHIVDRPEDSPFYGPLLRLPQNLSPGTRDSILGLARKVIGQEVIPAYRRIRDFFEVEYLPQTREDIGLSSIPNGAAMYQNRINYYTTSREYTARDIHQIGRKEVARIRSEMQTVITELGFQGTFSEFLEYLRRDPAFYPKSGDELLMKARDISKRIDAELPRFFKRLPRRPYGVIPVPEALAPKYTAGRYAPPRGDREPGYYLVNTYKLDSRPLYALPALTAHEAVPGHHLQISLNAELEDRFPEFRKNLYISAYGEGWALYTEYLADEMGIYTTPYEKFGQLTYEMWRACRLVVDTGIHALGWSREQLVDYMLKNTALSVHEVHTETDRYISWPGQALSYKMGEIKIRELRKEAVQELGEAFDIREFHHVILEEGTVTLPILERRIKAYIHSLK